MNVRFIDTSVMLNILDIPNMNSDAETIKKELQEAVDNEETLIGIGDLSIIRAYENYKKKMPGIGRIMIWSTDQHLAGYCEQEVSVHRRRYK